MLKENIIQFISRKLLLDLHGINQGSCYFLKKFLGSSISRILIMSKLLLDSVLNLMVGTESVPVPKTLIPISRLCYILPYVRQLKLMLFSIIQLILRILYFILNASCPHIWLYWHAVGRDPNHKPIIQRIRIKTSILDPTH